ncbi:MAG: hypothetical protein H8D46_04970 [FCB group bacterium]|nr:hypothetical protein [FCB group bacterium]
MKKVFKSFRKTGFTIVELSIASGMLLILIMGTTQFYSNIRKGFREADNKYAAWRSMSDRLENILAMDYDGILDSTMMVALLTEDNVEITINGKKGYRTTDYEVIYNAATFESPIDDDELPEGCAFCIGGIKPAILTIQYNGQACTESHNEQDPGDFTCTGDPGFKTPVFIRATEKSNPDDEGGKVWFSGFVELDSLFQADAANGGDNILKDNTYIHVFDPDTDDLLQTVKFRTKCDEPLNEGDQFGSLVTIAYIDENGDPQCGAGDFGDGVITQGGPGLKDGHFDLDTTDCDEQDCYAVGNSGTGKHTHEYDDKFDVTGADFFSVINDHATINEAISTNQRFKIILVNTHLSQSGRVVINDTYDPDNPATFTEAIDYADQYTDASSSIAAPPVESITGYDDFSSLPVYSTNGVSGSTQLDEFGVYFDIDAISNAVTGGPFNLHPTNTGDMKKNELGPNGEWRNGAITMWAVEVDEFGFDNFSIDMSTGHPHITDGLLWEANMFWHWKGPSFHENGWGTYEVGERYVEGGSGQGSGGQQEDLTICHHPPGNPGNGHTIIVGSEAAVVTHLNHGCDQGACGIEMCGFCDDNGNDPKILKFKYTGDNCWASHHAQPDNKVSCEGYPELDDSVHVLVTNKNNPDNNKAKVWFDGIVYLDSTFEISAANAGSSKLDKGTYAYIYNVGDSLLLQGIGFHTSCTQPLYYGEQFGSLMVTGFIDDNDIEICEGIADGGGEQPEEPACEFCPTDDNPTMLEFRYTGENCDASDNSLPDGKFECDGDPELAHAAYIRVTDKSNPDDGGAKVFFSAGVGINTDFQVYAATAGEAKLKNDLFFHIYSGLDAEYLQYLKIHTSCSEDLFQGDQFGSLIMKRFADESGQELCIEEQDEGAYQTADYLIKVKVKFAWEGEAAPVDSVSMFISPQRSWKWD